MEKDILYNQNTVVAKLISDNVDFRAKERGILYNGIKVN